MQETASSFGTRGTVTAALAVAGLSFAGLLAVLVLHMRQKAAEQPRPAAPRVEPPPVQAANAGELVRLQEALAGARKDLDQALGAIDGAHRAAAEAAGARHLTEIELKRSQEKAKDLDARLAQTAKDLERIVGDLATSRRECAEKEKAAADLAARLAERDGQLDQETKRAAKAEAETAQWKKKAADNMQEAGRHEAAAKQLAEELERARRDIDLLRKALAPPQPAPR